MEIATLLFWDGESVKADGAKIYSRFNPELEKIYNISVIPTEGDLYKAIGCKLASDEAELAQLKKDIFDLRKENYLVYITLD